MLARSGMRPYWAARVLAKATAASSLLENTPVKGQLYCAAILLNESSLTDKTGAADFFQFAGSQSDQLFGSTQLAQFRDGGFDVGTFDFPFAAAAVSAGSLQGADGNIVFLPAAQGPVAGKQRLFRSVVIGGYHGNFPETFKICLDGRQLPDRCPEFQFKFSTHWVPPSIVSI